MFELGRIAEDFIDVPTIKAMEIPERRRDELFRLG